MTTQSDDLTLIGPPPIPLPSIVDAGGNVWTIGPAVGGFRYALVNNVATNGRSVALLWFGGAIYSKSPKAPGNWWKWDGTVAAKLVNKWVDTGSTADPAGRTPPIVSVVAQTWDGSAWALS